MRCRKSGTRALMPAQARHQQLRAPARAGVRCSITRSRSATNSWLVSPPPPPPSPTTPPPPPPLPTTPPPPPPPVTSTYEAPYVSVASRSEPLWLRWVCSSSGTAAASTAPARLLLAPLWRPDTMPSRPGDAVNPIADAPVVNTPVPAAPPPAPPARGSGRGETTGGATSLLLRGCSADAVPDDVGRRRPSLCALRALGRPPSGSVEGATPGSRRLAGAATATASLGAASLPGDGSGGGTLSGASSTAFSVRCDAVRYMVPGPRALWRGTSAVRGSTGRPAMRAAAAAPPPLDKNTPLPPAPPPPPPPPPPLATALLGGPPMGSKPRADRDRDMPAVAAVRRASRSAAAGVLKYGVPYSPLAALPALPALPPAAPAPRLPPP